VSSATERQCCFTNNFPLKDQSRKYNRCHCCRWHTRNTPEHTMLRWEWQLAAVVMFPLCLAKLRFDLPTLLVHLHSNAIIWYYEWNILFSNSYTRHHDYMTHATFALLWQVVRRIIGWWFERCIIWLYSSSQINAKRSIPGCKKILYWENS